MLGRQDFSPHQSVVSGGHEDPSQGIPPHPSHGGTVKTQQEPESHAPPSRGKDPTLCMDGA